MGLMTGGVRTAGAGVPVPSVDIAVALKVFCAIPECARDALRRVCEIYPTVNP